MNSYRSVIGKVRFWFQVTQWKICRWPSGTETAFSWSFGFPRQYHSTNAPYSSSSRCCSFQEGKELKPVNIPKSKALSLNWGALDRKILSLQSGFQGLQQSVLLSLTQENAVDLLRVSGVPNSYVDGLWKTCRSCPTHESLIAWPLSHWSTFEKRFVYKILKSNSWTALTIQNTTENNCIISHVQNKLMYFSLEYMGYLSQTREIRLSPVQTTAKVNCKLLSQYLYIFRHRSKPLLLLTFRHRASCILGQAFHYSPENAFYIFNQQIYFIIWYLLDRVSLI